MDLWIYGFMDLWIYGFMENIQNKYKYKIKLPTTAVNTTPHTTYIAYSTYITYLTSSTYITFNSA